MNILEYLHTYVNANSTTVSSKQYGVGDAILSLFTRIEETQTVGFIQFFTHESETLIRIH